MYLAFNYQWNLVGSPFLQFGVIWGLSRSWDTAQNGYVNMEHDDPPLGFGGSFESMAGLSVTTDDVL